MAQGPLGANMPGRDGSGQSGGFGPRREFGQGGQGGRGRDGPSRGPGSGFGGRGGFGRGPGGPRGGGAGGGGYSGFGGKRRGQRVAPEPLRIIYEDAWLIAVEKPAGMALSVPPGRDRHPGTQTIQDQVLAHVREGGGRKAGAWGVHELDREASGLVVFAKSPAAAESVRAAFAAKKADAIYLSVVGGMVAPMAMVTPTRGGGAGDKGEESNLDESGAEGGEFDGPVGGSATRPATGTVRSFIRRVGTQVESIPPGEFSGDRASAKRPEAPRLAITHYKVVGSGRGRTMLRLRVKSPRMHQARAHMQDLGHSVVGDVQYGSSETSNRVLLHLAEIAFPHPETKAPLRMTCPAPSLFWDAIGSAPPAEIGESKRQGSSAGGAGERGRGESDARGWEHVAEWYDALVSGTRSDLQDKVVTPGVLRLLGPRRGERVLDVACGPGELVRTLGSMGVAAMGVDVSPRMIELARQRASSDAEAAGAGLAGAVARFEVCDARELERLRDGLSGAGGSAGSVTSVAGGADGARGENGQAEALDGVTCVMALMNIDPLSAVARGVGSLLKPGGRFVAVILHPAFRSPGMTSWGWTEQAGSGTGRGAMVRKQYRRVDAYLGESARDVTMNPGAVARGESAVVTQTFHRPIGAYVSALAEAGLLVDRLEEWASPRKSESGPRAAEEDRARAEIPMFLAIRAVKAG